MMNNDMQPYSARGMLALIALLLGALVVIELLEFLNNPYIFPDGW